MIAIIAILAAIMMPVLARSRETARRSVCSSNLRQVGVAWSLYLDDHAGLMPDRRDLKTALGYRPWSDWPSSDPRAGWAALVLKPYSVEKAIWNCPSVESTDLGRLIQVEQDGACYWMWRFDRADDPVPLDNLWGKLPDRAIVDLQLAQNPIVGFPESLSDVELTVDPYFPAIAPVNPNLRGRAVHFGGRNRLFLDGHVQWLRDIRTN